MSDRRSAGPPKGATLIPVLDDGADAKAHCKASGVVSLATGIKLAYQVYDLRRQTELQVGAGVEPGSSNTLGSGSKSSDKVIMIMGFAAGAHAWLPTLKDLFARGDKAAGIEVVVYDNRGIGLSSCPAAKSAYTTDIMAADALALMVRRAGGNAVVSGGSEAIPLSPKAIWAALRGALRSDPHARARADLSFHFSPKLLERQDPDSGRRVKAVLVEEYVGHTKEHGFQSKQGQVSLLTEGSGRAVTVTLFRRGMTAT
ncbi:hypothetical protein TSOC_003025 [Tetrabaena socialis]|uniref:AB hydrolase-1 domain-containing protein n=1 Tax=Tetrabaena socialis TaxID=47790 RepID=A0A2J8ACL7_9CHLO|nr:hypothetical protein TSOC_003025 [Tetrabaena socialis]|eukprot:PNH10265.1 hypothetical protein TSOC_003025 [Tetrabaena socialis]